MIYTYIRNWISQNICSRHLYSTHIVWKQLKWNIYFNYKYRKNHLKSVLLVLRQQIKNNRKTCLHSNEKYFQKLFKNLNETCKKNIKKKILLSIHPYYWLDDTSTKYWIIFCFYFCNTANKKKIFFLFDWEKNSSQVIAINFKEIKLLVCLYMT